MHRLSLTLLSATTTIPCNYPQQSIYIFFTFTSPSHLQHPKCIARLFTMWGGHLIQTPCTMSPVVDANIWIWSLLLSNLLPFSPSQQEAWDFL